MVINIFEGSSETTREAFCFDLYLKYKPAHIKTVNFIFLQWFIGFSEGTFGGSFHCWYDKRNKQKRAGFTIDQKDPKVLYWIRKELGFGTVLPTKGYWRFQVWDRENLHRIYCLFAGNMVLDKTHLHFQRWSTFLVFPSQFSISDSYSQQMEKNKRSGAGLIALNNAWLSGFWQADGGFYATGTYKDNQAKLFNSCYITQRQESNALNCISIAIHGKKKKISQIVNKSGQINRLDFASLDTLSVLIAYLNKYKLVGEKRLTFLRWCRIFNMRMDMDLQIQKDKYKCKDLLLSLKSIKKLKRLIAATRTCVTKTK